ncbi:hypothetical protein B2M27_01020 [Kluyvera intermedia]|uniref:Uncharacterized protein n=1 Tax=Kluyvera intermedia TaxID=61648 RepID=A0ABX3ULQ7_KLUIN|nr:hypothetical protein B2M27_01020 [Kluyvera intermedia]
MRLYLIRDTGSVPDRRGEGSPQKMRARPGPSPLGERAPVSRQRLIDFQPDPVIAVTVLFLLSGVIAVNRKITGDSSALRERAGVRGKMRLGRWVPFTVSIVRSPGKRSAAGDAPDDHYNLVNVAK